MNSVKYIIGKIIPLPRSAYEKLQSLPVSSVQIDLVGSLPQSSVVRVSVSELAFLRSTAQSVAAVIMFNLSAANSNSLITLDTVQFTAVLQNKQPLQYSKLLPTVVKAQCQKYSDVSYSLPVSCPDGVYLVKCPAKSRGYVNISCPSYEDIPTCVLWDGK